MFKWSSSDQPVLKVRLASTTDLTTAYDMLDREFAAHRAHPRRGRVDITGAPPNEVEIAIDPNRLNAHGLSINELSERLRTLNFSISAGRSTTTASACACSRWARSPTCRKCATW